MDRRGKSLQEIEAEKNEAYRKLLEESELIKTVFSNPQGEKLLKKWERMFVRRISHFPDNTPEHTAFLEGQRYVVISILEIMEAANER